MMKEFWIGSERKREADGRLVNPNKSCRTTRPIISLVGKMWRPGPVPGFSPDWTRGQYSVLRTTWTFRRPQRPALSCRSRDWVFGCMLRDTTCGIQNAQSGGAMIQLSFPL